MSQLTPKLRETFAEGYNRIRSGELKTLIPYLCLFRLNGKPMNLRLHYQLAPMYATVQPSHSVYMLARQLGKSYAMCEDIALTHRGLESKLGLSKTTVRKATATLIQKGFLRRVGSKKGGRWEIVD